MRHGQYLITARRPAPRRLPTPSLPALRRFTPPSRRETPCCRRSSRSSSIRRQSEQLDDFGFFRSCGRWPARFVADDRGSFWYHTSRQALKWLVQNFPVGKRTSLIGQWNRQLRNGGLRTRLSTFRLVGGAELAGIVHQVRRGHAQEITHKKGRRNVLVRGTTAFGRTRPVRASCTGMRWMRSRWTTMGCRQVDGVPPNDDEDVGTVTETSTSVVPL